MKMLMLAAIAALSFNTFTVAQAQEDEQADFVRIVTADKMTCQQALATYEKYGRIYVIANRKDVVPIYGMPAKSKWGNLKCGRTKRERPYWVRTTDDETCVIASYCG